MAYAKKVWKDRQTEYPTRRRLSPTGTEDVYDVSRDEGLVIEEGDAFSAANMNDLEGRIESLIPRTLSFSLASSGWTVCTEYDGAAYSGGDLWQQQVEDSKVTAATCLTVLADNALAQQMENDGATALWPETAEGSVTFYVRGAKLTADMALSCLAQETGAPSEPQGEGEQG